MSQSYTLEDLQGEVEKWSRYNFPGKKPYQPLLGVVEEVGELAHSHLKNEQGIRGNSVEHFNKSIDAVGDVIIYLADYCSQMGIDMQTALDITWHEVKKRDWIKYPKNGRTE